MSINFCHISPTSHLYDYTRKNGAHLVLAHLIECDPAYRDYYANLEDDRPKIMDNGAFEMFKAGRPMYPADKLIEMARLCKATYVVMPDYPKQKPEKTQRAATDIMSKLVDEGRIPFFCPQSELGDLSGLLASIEWAIEEPRIGLIGISILNAPVALGVEERSHHDAFAYGLDHGPDLAFRMQRFLSRWALFREMEKVGILSMINKQAMLTHGTTKKFHMLGMVDGPNEIDLVREYHKYIFSWDSSAAVWAGMHGIEFDKSPTGLRNGKFEKEVDFGIPPQPISLQVLRNIAYINSLCESHK